MFSNKRVEGWSDLTLQHLVVAYRKAKVDCFFERSQCDAEDFASFEANLGQNLAFILSELRAGSIDKLLLHSIGAEGSDAEGAGSPELATASPEALENLFGLLANDARATGYWALRPEHPTCEVVAKKLARDRKLGAANGHGYFSRPERALQHLQEEFDLVPEFRLLGRFSVLGHILSALWINTAGHRFDKTLSDDVYGARVRRYRAAPGSLRGEKGVYHVDAPGTFPPYFGPYREWRSNGFAAIERELRIDRRVVAISLDLSNYYHRIDPGFIALPGFQKAVGVDLNDFERSFTQSLATALTRWSGHAASNLKSFGCTDSNGLMGGIPIGLACTRVIANVLLFRLDSEIRRELVPIYYGRYVDDIFLVIADSWDVEAAPTTAAVFEFVSKRVPSMTRGAETLDLEFGNSYAGASRLCLQEKKQKMFFLDGQAGLDLLGSIRQHISAVASERRFLPNPDELEVTAAAQVLTAAGDVAEEADSLRRADGLSVRRLGWSVQLRNVETLARDLDPTDWHKQRSTFYEFARNHVIRADRLLDHVDYLPRLIALAVSVPDWEEASRLLRCAELALELLSRVATSKNRCNGYVLPPAQGLVDKLQQRMSRICADAVLRSLPWSANGLVTLSSSAQALLSSLSLPTGQKEVEARALQLLEADLARTPYRDHLRKCAKNPRARQEADGVVVAAFPERELAAIREFLGVRPKEGSESCARTTALVRDGGVEESLLPYLFPTRPYSARAVALHDSACVHGPGATRRWASHVRALRGVWVRPSSDADLPGEAVTEGEVTVGESAFGQAADSGSSDGSGPSAEAPPDDGVWKIGRGRFSTVTLGISCLWTEDRTWALSAAGKEDIGLERYLGIRKMVNEAVKVQPRITHLLLPEFALPSRWLESVTARLSLAGISLVSGLDYFSPDRTTSYSEAVLVLSDDRLGFPSCIEIRQPKGVPAREEEESLLRLYERAWPKLPQEPKAIFSHRGFDFGVLVCSELQNIRHRSRFQGQVDCVMVLSWNRDVETFSALVESAALDVHAYIALVNNRQYGDSRVRSPAKLAYKRDLCRLQGGKNDYLAVVELALKELRQFQSRAKAWSRKDDPFKPVPEGFQIARRRRLVPK